MVNWFTKFYIIFIESEKCIRIIKNEFDGNYIAWSSQSMMFQLMSTWLDRLS